MLHLQTLSSTFQNIYYIARNILGGLGYEKIDGLHIVAKTDRKNEASIYEWLFWVEFRYVDDFCFKDPISRKRRTNINIVKDIA